MVSYFVFIDLLATILCLCVIERIIDFSRQEFMVIFVVSFLTVLTVTMSVMFHLYQLD